MLILMERGAAADQLQGVMELLAQAGIRAQVQEGPDHLSILAPHASQALKPDRLEALPGVRRVVPITSPFKLASADAAPARTVVEVRDVRIGDGSLALVAGPCGVESRDQLFTIARYVAEAGVGLLRAGAFKPRTSPYAFQGLGAEGLALLDAARKEFGLGIVTEATEVENFDAVERCADLVRRAPPDFALYTGDDATAMAFMLLGGHGVITVTGNVAPKAMHDLCQRSLAGDITGARAINDALMGLHKQLFIEANPIPVKWAVQQMGLIGPGIRLPLTPLSQQCQEAVRQAMQQGGVAFLARCGFIRLAGLTAKSLARSRRGLI